MVVNGTPVYCPSPIAWEQIVESSTGTTNHPGVFLWGEKAIYLSPPTCGALAENVPALAKGMAVFVLAHELAHAAGIRDETQADCQAARTFIDVATVLHLPQPDQLAMASRWSDGYDAEAVQDCWPRLPMVSF